MASYQGETEGCDGGRRRALTGPTDRAGPFLVRGTCIRLEHRCAFRPPRAEGRTHTVAALPMTPLRVVLVGARVEFLDGFERATATAHAEFDCKAGRESGDIEPLRRRQRRGEPLDGRGEDRGDVFQPRDRHV